jgi:hypothetical protein
VVLTYPCSNGGGGNQDMSSSKIDKKWGRQVKAGIIISIE